VIDPVRQNVQINQKTGHMNMRVLLLMGVVSVAGMNCADVSAQTNPSCIYPQWEWGQTGPIYHYYSEYVFITGGKHNCSLSYWDNYDMGATGLAVYYGCDSNETDCDPGGETTVLLPGTKVKIGKQKDSVQDADDPIDPTTPTPKPSDVGNETLNDKGYKKPLLDYKTEIKSKTGGQGQFVDVQRMVYIVIEFTDDSGDVTKEYFKLFETKVTGPRRKKTDVNGAPGTGKPNSGEPYTIRSSPARVFRLKSRPAKEPPFQSRCLHCQLQS